MGLTPLSRLLPSILATLRVRKSAISSKVCARVSSNFLRFFPWLFLNSFDFQQSQNVKMRLIPGFQPQKIECFLLRKNFCNIIQAIFFFRRQKEPEHVPPLLPSDLDSQIRGLPNSSNPLYISKWGCCLELSLSAYRYWHDGINP
jgi:hypothetical protein